MVYAVGEGVPQYETHTPDASSAGQEPGSSQRGSSPWTPPAAAQDSWHGSLDPWETPPGLADPYAQDLDAFGKGKGKGKQKGPLECYNCLGKGTHPECALLRREQAKAVDPSAPIATAKATLQPCAPAREEASTLRRLHPPRARAMARARATVARSRALAMARAYLHWKMDGHQPRHGRATQVGRVPPSGLPRMKPSPPGRHWRPGWRQPQRPALTLGLSGLRRLQQELPRELAQCIP